MWNVKSLVPKFTSSHKGVHITGQIRGPIRWQKITPFTHNPLEIHEDVHILSQTIHILSHITSRVCISTFKYLKFNLRFDMKSSWFFSSICFEFVYINFQDCKYYFQKNTSQRKQLNGTYLQKMIEIDNISKIFVPLLFLATNSLYWSYYWNIK